MPPKRGAQRRPRGPRLSAVVESPDRSSQETLESTEDVNRRVEAMEIDGDEDEDGLMNEEEDDYGQLLRVDIRSGDLEIIEEAELRAAHEARPVGPDEENLPLEQRGISLAVRQKYSRLRDGMSHHEKDVVRTQKIIKKMISDAFRSVFQARDNVNQVLLEASRKMILCFRKAGFGRNMELNMENLFYQQIDLRLTQMFEEVSVGENRGRVLKLCATVAMEFEVLGFGDYMLRFLVDYIEKWNDHPDVAKRTNAVVFACFIFETGLSRKRATDEVRTENPNRFCEMDLALSLRVFMILKRGLLDKEVKVRCPAIRGMSVIQKIPLPSSWPDDALEGSPREFVVRSIRDKSWECRLTALKMLECTDADVAMVCDVIAYDKATVVRVAALEKLGKMRPSWHPQVVTPVMVTAFRDHEVQVRDAAKSTLRAWITYIASKYRKKKIKSTDRDIIPMKASGEEEAVEDPKGKGYILGAQALVLVFYVNTPMTTEHQANLRRVVHQMLDVLRNMYHCSQDMMSTFVEQVNDDVKTMKNDRAVPLILKSTISSLLEDSEVVQGQDLNTTRSMVFFWRCFIEFIVDLSFHDADKSVALGRFLAPLKTMVESFEEFLIRVKHEEATAHQMQNQLHALEMDVYVMQMSLVENYLCAMRHAERDSTGKEAYQQLLVSMMMNPFYQKKIFDLVFQELTQFYHDCPEDLLSMFKARITQMRMNWKGDAFPEIENTVLVGSHKYENEWEEEMLLNRKLTRLELGRRFIDRYEVKILNCMLKTGLLPAWDNEYESRYGKMLRDQIAKTDHLSTKVNAIECLGIIGTYNFNLVKKDFEKLVRNWEKLDETIQATVVVCLTDLYLMNENAVEEINRIMVEEHPKPAVNDLRPFLGEILINEEMESGSELLLRAVEAFCRILLNSKMSPDDESAQRAIVALMHRASLKLNDNHDAKLRSTILTTLSLFSGMSQQNQMLIVRTFPRFFQSFTSNPHVVGLTDGKEDVLTKLKRVGACFVNLTRHSSLPPQKQARTKPAHLQLVRDILYEVDRANSDIVEFYLAALPHIEWDAIDLIEQRKLFGDLENTIMLHDESDTQDRARISELRKAKKKLARIIGINEDDEAPSEAPPQERNESRMSTATKRGVRQTPAYSVSSRAGSVAAHGGGPEEEREEESEVDEMEEDETPQDRRAVAKRKAAAARSVQNAMASPVEKPGRKAPSRPATASRPTRAPSTRSAAATPLRTSARRQNQDQK